MSRTFTIKELNEKIDKLIAEYKDYPAKIEALEDLKLELNEPETIVNIAWVEKVQESLNVITAQNIVNNDL